MPELLILQVPPAGVALSVDTAELEHMALLEDVILGGMPSYINSKNSVSLTSPPHNDIYTEPAICKVKLVLCNGTAMLWIFNELLESTITKFGAADHSYVCGKGIGGGVFITAGGGGVKEQYPSLVQLKAFKVFKADWLKSIKLVTGVLLDKLMVASVTLKHSPNPQSIMYTDQLGSNKLHPFAALQFIGVQVGPKAPYVPVNGVAAVHTLKQLVDSVEKQRFVILLFPLQLTKASFRFVARGTNGLPHEGGPTK